MRGRLGCIPLLETALCVKRKSSPRKKSEIHTLQVIKVDTHSQLSGQIWSLLPLEEPILYIGQAVLVSFQHVAFASQPLCGNYLFLNKPTYCRCCNEKMTVHYSQEFPPTIFWSSQAVKDLTANPPWFSWHLHQSGVNYFHVNWWTKIVCITLKMWWRIHWWNFIAKIPPTC